MTTAGTVLLHRPAQADTLLPVQGSGSLLDALRRESVDGPRAPCGGRGTCGKCAVRVRRGEGTPVAALACRVPAATVSEVWLESSDAIDVVTQFRPPKRAHRWVGSHGTVEGHTIAVDVGTMTIAAKLVALADGSVLAEVSDRNRQASYGADVISRIQRSEEDGPADQVACLRAQLADLAADLIDTAEVSADSVVGYTIAGNTVMEHFVAGLSPRTLGRSPFTPASRFGCPIPAAELGLPGRPSADAYLFPVVAGFVGGDVVAGALACGLDEGDTVRCFIDLGTNGEMMLASAGSLWTCATAAGPAFEGAELECGMPAIAGAVDRVQVRAGSLGISTIMDAPPGGICGSGLMDALAAAIELGLIDENGRLRTREEVRPALACHVSPGGEPPRLLLTPDGSVYLSQADIRALQLAKAAVAAGLDVLLSSAGLEPADVDEVYLCGGLGTRARPRSLATIGLLPTELARRAHPVGNAALAGAVLAADAPTYRQRLDRLAADSRYIELSGDRRFSTAFMERIAFDQPSVADLTTVLAAAADLGFESVAELDAATLTPSDAVRAMCQPCRAFGRNWSCPPACGSVHGMDTLLHEYSRGVIVQTVSRLEDDFDAGGIDDALRLHKHRFRRLTAALNRGFPRRLALGAGACTVCSDCTCPDEACRFPALATVSMEAAGLNVTDVCQRNAVAYYHGPRTVTFTSCVLLD